MPAGRPAGRPEISLRKSLRKSLSPAQPTPCFENGPRSLLENGRFLRPHEAYSFFANGPLLRPYEARSSHLEQVRRLLTTWCEAFASQALHHTQVLPSLSLSHTHTDTPIQSSIDICIEKNNLKSIENPIQIPL